MKILFYLNEGWRRYIGRSPHLLMVQQAERDSECRVEWCSDLASPPKTAEYDTIIAEPATETLEWLQATKALKVCFEFDIHRFTSEDYAAQRRIFDAFDIVLTPHRFARLPSWVFSPVESDRANMVLFPHCVPDEPCPVSEKTKMAVYPGTANSSAYPFRAWADSLGLGYDAPLHPGYGSGEKMLLHREEYFPMLSRYRVGLAGQVLGPTGYATAKYMDIPYAGCLLIAETPTPEEESVLGLVNGESCIYVKHGDADRLRGLYRCATRGFSPYENIASKGQAIVRSRHGTAMRMGLLKKILGFGRVPKATEQLRLCLDSMATPS